MKKIITILGLLAGAWFYGQNKFLNQDYWKANPTIDNIKKDIAEGNSPSEFNDGQFDPVSLAILNDAKDETIIYLLSQDGNAVNKVTHDGRIYLHWASFKNRKNLVEYLIKAKSDLFAKDTGGRTPFDFGALGGMKKEIFELYFKAGYPIQQLDENGANALMAAAGRDNENLETTKYLISKGINPKNVDKYGRTLVDYAARAGNVKTVTNMVKEGYPYTDQSLIMAAMGIRTTNDLPIFKYLIETIKINPNTIDHQGKNALHYLAGRDKSEEQVDYLINRNINTVEVDKDGATPFLYAARNKNTKNASAILNNGKNKALVNTGNNNAQSPIMMAAQYSTPEMMNLLIKNGAKINAKDKKGNSILYYIIESYPPRRKDSNKNILQKLETIQKLGFDFKTKNAEENTLLHLAAEKDNTELMAIALKFNAQLDEKNSQGNTPIMNNAMVATNDETMKLLIEKGAKTNIENEFGETVFSIASENEILTEKKIDLTFLNK